MIDQLKRIRNYANRNNNITSLVVCFSVLFLQQFFNHYGDYQYLNIASIIIFLHCFIDIFLTESRDVFIHHIFVLLISTSKHLFKINWEDDTMIFLTLATTEISTIFYSASLIMDEHKDKLKKFSFYQPIYNVNNFVFLAIFFKTRICDYYTNIIHNPNTYINLFKYTGYSFWKNLYLYTGIHGLYLLNLYWFCIIIKKLYKQIVIKFFPKINNERIAVRMQSYIYFFNVPIATYVYSFAPSKNYIFDMTGVVNMSIQSYLFHNSKYVYLQDNSIVEYTHKNIHPFYIKDVCSIHLRSFFALVTNFHLSSYSIPAITLSGIIHICGIGHFIKYMFSLYYTNTPFYNNKSEESKTHLFTTNLLTSLPVIVDTLIFIINTNNIEAKVELYIVTVCLGLILTVEPFYELNHVLFHLFLLLQTVAICRGNIANNEFPAI